MIKSTLRAAPNFLGNEFNPFLFAPVGTDRNGGQLSVVSALARLDLDAWEEAASLARLPRDVAVGKLAALLRRFTELPQIVSEAGTIATRLLALLPNQSRPVLPGRAIQALSKPASAQSHKAALRTGAAGLGLLLAVAVLCGLQYASQSPRAAAAPPPAATSAPLATPPPS